MYLPASQPQVQSLKGRASHASGAGERARRSDAEGRGGGVSGGVGGAVGAGGDPLKEAFNLLGSVIDFQAQQQVTLWAVCWILIVDASGTVFMYL